MPPAFVHSYSDPEQLEQAYAAADVELLPTQKGPFEARVVSLDFDQLWMRRVEESAPRLKWAAQSPKRTFVQFLTGRSTEPVIDGEPLQAKQIIQFSKGHRYFEHSTGALSWAALSLPVKDPSADRIAIAGHDITLARSPARKVPDPGAFAKLRRLHAEVATLVETRPAAIAMGEVSHALEQSLLHALADCLSDPQVHSDTGAHSRHDIIMNRFRRSLEAEPDRAFYVPEICDAIKVPERTLRLCCQERLGMSPKHYLLLRRMHLARRALGVSDHRTATVTEIATRLGFWHFGRFAGCYRLMFGEPPSATLHREKC